jgi:hypothetical protein
MITLHRLEKAIEYSELINRVMKWTIEHMQSSEGYFYFQKNKMYTTKIPYMRWSQAWMFYALSTFLLTFSKKNQT